ncbi:hypothetical protein ACHWQZ_G014028 [Mnemiopsis leidyi]
MSELNKRGRSKRKTRESGNDDLNTGKDQPKFKKLTLEDYRKRDTESSDSRAGISTPPPTPPIPNTPVDKEFTMKETSPVNDEDLRPRTETTQIILPLPSTIKGKEAITTEPELPEPCQSTELPEQDQSTETPPLTPPLVSPTVEKKSSSPNLTEGEEQEPPTPTFRVGICLKTLNTTLGQADLDNIRLILLKATLETPALADLEVTNNITDIKGNKIIIKTKNFQTINLVRDIMSVNDRYTTIIEEDLPGLRVRILLPSWMKVFVEQNQIVKLITIHHPTLNSDSFNQYQPIKNLDNGATLIYFSLDYKAQVYFARLDWRINLLGSTLTICDPDKRDRSAPDITQDLGNVQGLGLTDTNH